MRVLYNSLAPRHNTGENTADFTLCLILPDTGARRAAHEPADADVVLCVTDLAKGQEAAETLCSGQRHAVSLASHCIALTGQDGRVFKTVADFLEVIGTDIVGEGNFGALRGQRHALAEFQALTTRRGPLSPEEKPDTISLVSSLLLE